MANEWDSGSSYDPSSRFYNRNAYGNQGFSIQNPQQMGYGGQSPVSMGIQNYMGGQSGQGGQSFSPMQQYPSSYTQGAQGPWGQQAPTGQMDPRMFGFYASTAQQGQQQQGQMALQQQGQQYQGSAVENAIKRIQPTMQAMGVPNAGDAKKQFDTAAGMESQPIMQAMESYNREVEQDASRRGASLSSNRDKLKEEGLGAALSGMRNTTASSLLRYIEDMLKAGPSYVSALRG
jgi:hypothetical protein